MTLPARKRLLEHGEAHALQHGDGVGVGVQVVQEGLGGGLAGLVGAALHHGGGVDHLVAHVGGGLIHHGQLIGKGVGGVDDAAVHRGLLHLVGYLGDVGGVSHLARALQSGDVNAQDVYKRQPQTKLEIDGRVSLADIRSYGGGAVDVFVAGSTCLRREDLPGSFEQLFALRGQVISEAKE